MQIKIRFQGHIPKDIKVRAGSAHGSNAAIHALLRLHNAAHRLGPRALSRHACSHGTELSAASPITHPQPLSEDKALQAGADVFSELFVYSIAAVCKHYLPSFGRFRSRALAIVMRCADDLVGYWRGAGRLSWALGCAIQWAFGEGAPFLGALYMRTVVCSVNSLGGARLSYPLELVCLHVTHVRSHPRAGRAACRVQQILEKGEGERAGAAQAFRRSRGLSLIHI